MFLVAAPGSEYSAEARCWVGSGMHILMTARGVDGCCGYNVMVVMMMMTVVVVVVSVAMRVTMLMIY